MLHMHCCCMPETLQVLNYGGCAGSTATYTICCALLWALLLILYAVYCRMFVPWALPLILYAVYCCMFVPWALPLMYMLCTATCLCHRHCIVTVNCLLWQCCLTLYVVHTLPPGFPLWALLLYMEYNVMLGALCMCCHMTHY